MAVTHPTRRDLRLRTTMALALAGRASDELWVTMGIVCVIVGVALIYLPAAFIAGGLCAVAIGVGRMRA